MQNKIHLCQKISCGNQTPFCFYCCCPKWKYVNTAELRIMVHDHKWHMQCQTLFVTETGLTYLCFTWMYGWRWLPRSALACRDGWEENLSFIFAKFPLAQEQWRTMLCWFCAADHCSQVFFIYGAHCLSVNLFLWTGTKKAVFITWSQREKFLFRAFTWFKG